MELKTIAISNEVHAQLSQCASERGMLLRGLTERIIIDWMGKNFFPPKVSSGNKRRASK